MTSTPCSASCRTRPCGSRVGSRCQRSTLPLLHPPCTTLGGRRPDLLALALGYESQEKKVRQTIIEQFPALSIGTAFSRDTSDVRTDLMNKLGYSDMVRGDYLAAAESPCRRCIAIPATRR